MLFNGNDYAPPDDDDFDQQAYDDAQDMIFQQKRGN